MQIQGEKVKLIRQRLGMSQAKFARSLGVSAPGIAKIETGDRPLTEQMRKSIINAHRINPDYLEGKSDDMYRRDEDLAQLLGIILAGKNEFAKELFLAFAKLGPEQWDHLEDIIKTLKK